MLNAMAPSFEYEPGSGAIGTEEGRGATAVHAGVSPPPTGVQCRVSKKRGRRSSSPDRPIRAKRAVLEDLRIRNLIDGAHLDLIATVANTVREMPVAPEETRELPFIVSLVVYLWRRKMSGNRSSSSSGAAGALDLADYVRVGEVQDVVNSIRRGVTMGQDNLYPCLMEHVGHRKVRMARTFNATNAELLNQVLGKLEDSLKIYAHNKLWVRPP